MAWTTILPSAITIGVVFLYACLGEIIMEKSGHLNLGIPGILCFGAVGGSFGISLYMSMFSSDPLNAPYLPLVLFAIIFSAAFSLIAGLIYAFLTVTLKCNQNVTGLALTIFGAGFADFFMNTINKDYFSQASKIIRYQLPFADSLGDIGKIFFSHSILIYLGIVLAVVTAIVIKRTKVGLSLRAVGENPATADAAGINVTKYKYGAILIGSMIAGLAGITYIMVYVGGSWENSSTLQSFGWLAIALVIFTVWKPSFAILGSILFGFLYILPFYITGIGFLEMKLLNLTPYVITIIVLIFTSIIGRKSVQPPASLGLTYFREER